ncbi:hypothetical protein [Bergeriella denitrificans]|uniref:Lipoprotein n=1 Tax=Bergeriella denitrificans TaxID=494 RepID=A0A378UF23_BERDE|nr:hypothetical protein [Bergeriella denitrificans]STZ76008.1 Uncharacterised protein [Bergeriella denitrificans]
MRHTITAALLLLTAACGSYKAVRHAEPAPVIADTPTHAVRYAAPDGQTLTAVYINSNSPMTVDLQQGNTVERLQLVNTWTQGAEYSSYDTRWHVQDNTATLTRRNRPTVFTEIAE